MNYRQVDILAEESADTAGTKTIDLRIKKPISRILIRFKATNVSYQQSAHPCANVSEIELVDGSDVLFSLSGYECQALNYYDNLVTPDSEIIGAPGNYIHAVFLLDFGRYLWDEQLAFDPTRFTNPQLKITHNKATSDTSATAGFLLVKADVFDEKEIMPVGFLMNKQIHAYTATGGTYKYIDLPTDHPYRKLLVRAYTTNKSFESSVSKFKLSEDNDHRVPIETDIEPYIRYLCGILPPLHEHFQMNTDLSALSMYVMPTYWPMVYGMPFEDDTIYRSGSYYEAERQGLVGTVTGQKNVAGVVCGYVPHQVLAWMFGRQMDIDDWYDVTKIGSLQMRLYEVSGQTPAVSTFIQQLRRY